MCRLCLREHKLLKKSHIIPEFMYGGLFDDHHKLFKVRPADYVKKAGRMERQASGEYEAGILCRSCDNVVIGKYESYARTVYSKAHSQLLLPDCKDLTYPGGVRFRRCDGVEYCRFKLFLLSILWRASISMRPIFNETKVGSEHEEKLRLMILHGDAGQSHEYPILMISYLEEPTPLAQMVGQPGLTLLEGKPRFLFPIAGAVYLFHLDQDAVPERLRPFVLHDSNYIDLLYTPEGMTSKLLMGYFGL